MQWYSIEPEEELDSDMVSEEQKSFILTTDEELDGEEDEFGDKDD